jgi:AcrR family transcriptional regulator
MDDQTTAPPRKARPPPGDNRARLIAAGHTIRSEKGVEAATVKEIARLAGVSPGLFHYYFASKDELLLAVMWEAGLRFQKQLAQDLQASTDIAGDARPAALITAHALGHKDPAWFRLRYELFALGLRNPTFLPEIGKYLAATRRGMAQWIRSSTGMESARAQAAAAIMLACFDGLALQQLAEPDLDLGGAYAVMQSLLRAEPVSKA